MLNIGLKLAANRKKKVTVDNKGRTNLCKIAPHSKLHGLFLNTRVQHELYLLLFRIKRICSHKSFNLLFSLFGTKSQCIKFKRTNVQKKTREKLLKSRKNLYLFLIQNSSTVIGE